MSLLDFEVDVELLISAAEQRPVLWDKTADEYKCKTKTVEAWTEVCKILTEDFDSFTPKQKDAFRKAVTKKWTNVKDSWMKSYKNYLETSKSGYPAKQKYKFRNQLSFLTKVINPKESMADQVDDYWDDHESLPIQFTEDEIKVEPSSSSRKRKLDDDNPLPRKNLDSQSKEPGNHHMSFFSGILPSLNSFNEEQILEFQIGVLNLIKTIKSTTSY